MRCTGAALTDSNLSERIRSYRSENGISRQELADALGVSPITVLRWENGTSRPASLVAVKLESLGFGPIAPQDTKAASTPRASRDLPLGFDLNKRTYKICFNGTDRAVVPSPYVLNGPMDQDEFFQALLRLQSHNHLAIDEVEYSRRLSAVASVPGLVASTAQFELENPKRTAAHWNSNYGPHGWHRYVGRFPPHLVRGLLNHFQAKPGEIVCDPFLGSGTTLVEARLLGLRGIGIEISPLSCMISRAKTGFPTDRSNLEELGERLGEHYGHQWSRFLNGRQITNITFAEVVRRPGNPIPDFPNASKWFTAQAFLGVSLVVEFLTSLSGYERDFLGCALSGAMRSIGNVDVDVVRAEYSKKPRESVDVLYLVTRAIRKMLTALERTQVTHSRMISASTDVTVVEGNIKATELPQGVIDYVITSPPYGVESLSYIRTHLLSYRALHSILGYDPYERNDGVIGSEFFSDQTPLVMNHEAGRRSRTFDEYFQSISNGVTSPKFQSRANMMSHFFDDMTGVADSLMRWLRPGGKVAFVIGNKKLGDSTIPTNVIISEIFESFGLMPYETIKHKLKTNNSNSEVPWQERVIQEEFVMLFERAG